MAANIPNTNTDSVAGKGEQFLSRPTTFFSAYREVFNQHRGVFGDTTGTDNKLTQTRPDPAQVSYQTDFVLKTPNLLSTPASFPKSGFAHINFKLDNVIFPKALLQSILVEIFKVNLFGNVALKI